MQQQLAKGEKKAGREGNVVQDLEDGRVGDHQDANNMQVEHSIPMGRVRSSQGGHSTTFADRGIEGILTEMTLSDLHQAVPDMESGLELAEDEEEVGDRCVNGVMNPHWTMRLGWDFLVILLVLMDALFLPLQMAFKTPPDLDEGWLWLSTVMFFLDMVLSFNTAYEAGPREPGVELGKLVTHRCRITRNYLRTWFIIDFMSTVPFSQVASLFSGSGGDNQNSAQVVKLTKILKLVRFLRLIRMLRLAKLAVIWERIESRMGSLLLVQTIALMRILFVLVAICHWNACLWWLIGQPKFPFIHDLFSQNTQEQWEFKMRHWTTEPRIDAPGRQETWTWLERSGFEAYLFCFYWTLGVMRTMPSEVTPANIYERGYIMVFMFFAFSTFAITITLITQTFFKMSERKRGFNDDMAAVRTHLRTVKLSEPVQMKIKAFLRHLYDRRRIHAKELAMYKQLPKALSEHMMLGRTGHIVQRLAIFKGVPDRYLLQIIQITEQLDLSVGEVLCRRGKVAEAAWLLVEGKLSISYSRQSGQGLCPVEEGLEVIDEECLRRTTPVESEFTVFACVCSEVLRLDKKNFFKCLEKNRHLEAYLKHNFDIKNIVSMGRRPSVTRGFPGKNAKASGLTLMENEIDITAAIISS